MQQQKRANPSNKDELTRGTTLIHKPFEEACLIVYNGDDR